MTMMMRVSLLGLLWAATCSSAFVPQAQAARRPASWQYRAPSQFQFQFQFRMGASTASTEEASTYSAVALQSSVQELKKVLAKEYMSFFSPMRTEYYSPGVTFLDPMTTLEGVEGYQKNVDMLASRTTLGKFLFQDALINLHSVEGGTTNIVNGVPKIEDLQTRWTLKVTAKVFPWKPTAVFTGVSIYKVEATGPKGVQVVGQLDYWDSINIQPGSEGKYQSVPTNVAVQDFVGQLKPPTFGGNAQAAGPELPFSLLRRGDGYDVRRYPAYTAVRLPYTRRDEGFGSLGSFTRGMNPMAPALMEVPTKEEANKYMMWPLTFVAPGQEKEGGAP
eukprot:CAMPEP_0198290626 /NCGR_PEP_ID=MMETSP1449-20131203/8419_1 /TAXON_ID=420275 /ORGANISM="Attheya septentrionalis, Strain CCMP2084" /LENGTH=332 /DNA_ID=CAMNT_0043989149 /DNA_START=61 /DNA_END=1056 /DNA_ORIENTATION=+